MPSILQPPWPLGAATGVGSLPYDDPLEAARIVFGEVPAMPFLPELPGRGPGASMVGRGCALLVELGADLQPSGWRLTTSSRATGLDQRRAISFLGQDVDAIEAIGFGWTGALKVQVIGPWTLAATVERPGGGAVVGDIGARRDLAQSLIDGVTEFVAGIRRRFPAASVVLQVDEPSLPAVLAAGIPTPSGMSRYRSVSSLEAVDTLRPLLSVPDVFPVVHCCAPDFPLSELVNSGAKGLMFDHSLVKGPDFMDGFGAAVESGLALFAGIVPTSQPASMPSDVALAKDLLAWWRAIGFSEESAATSVVVTPACGLGFAPPPWARDALALAKKVGDHLAG